MRLKDVLRADDVTTDLPAADKEGTLRGLARLFCRSDGQLDEDTVYRAFVERERVGSTGIGSGVAMPHGRLRLDRTRMALAICREGVPFDSFDGAPAHILIALLTPFEHPSYQVKMLARVSNVLKDGAVRDRLLRAETRDDALRILVEEDQRH